MPTKFVMKKRSLKEQILHEEEYLKFLEKKLSSKNFKANVSSEEFSETEQKFKKSKLVLKMLKSK